MDIEFKIDLNLTNEDLDPEVRVEVLIAVVEEIGTICGVAPREGILSLFAAGALMIIRNSPPGSGPIALEVRDMSIEAVEFVRFGKWPSRRALQRGWNSSDDD